VKRLFPLLFFLIFVIGAALRFYRYADRAPYDWDQARDYQAVSALAGGKLTLVGPVAKGDGGPHLGPLYYYLLLPGYLLTGGSPFAQPATSIVLDLITLVVVGLLTGRFFDRHRGLLIASFYAVSPLLVDSSRISWNVILVSLWVFLMLFALSRLTHFNHPRALVTLGFLAGLAWHIHALLIPLSILLFLPAISSRKLPFSSCLMILGGYLLTLSPLLFFQLRHDFLDYRVLTNFTLTSPVASSLLQVTLDAFSKLAKFTTALFLGRSLTSPFIGLVAFTLSLWGFLRSSHFLKLCSLVIVTTFILVLVLRDLGFPEYYLGATIVPLLFLFADLIFTVLYPKLILTCTTLILLISLTRFNSFLASPYSLGVKSRAACAAAQVSTSIDLRTEFSFRREGGVVNLVRRCGASITESSPAKVLITDKLNDPHYQDGVLMTEIYREGGLLVLSNIAVQ